MIKKYFSLVLIISMIMVGAQSFAATSKIEYHGTHGKNSAVTPKSVGAGALSLIIWPGIGQLMNDEKNTEKAAVHALLGFTGIFRIWSGYDGIVNRKGGVWDNRI